MKIFPWMLLFVLFFGLVGCVPQQPEEQVIEEEMAGPVQEEDIFDPAQAEVYTDRWPSDMLPAIIPEYTAGTIVGYSGIQSALSITVTDTTEEDVRAYRRALQDSAFALSETDVATKDDIEVSVDFLELSHSAIISVTYIGSELWPAEMIMNIPPLDYGVITYLSLADPDRIFMRVNDLSREHAHQWFDQLEEEGFAQTAHGYIRDDAVITLTDYNQGEWDIQIALSR